jgi:hypothetical protein
VPADLDLHWSHTHKNAYIWRKGLNIFWVSMYVQKKHVGTNKSDYMLFKVKEQSLNPFINARIVTD